MISSFPGGLALSRLKKQKKPDIMSAHQGLQCCSSYGTSCENCGETIWRALTLFENVTSSLDCKETEVECFSEINKKYSSYYQEFKVTGNTWTVVALQRKR
eukprot:TRINITY_DN7314_c0_g1_i1.p1 TRINITY_DN7314_c0_g1~~TRINITY_DN7314_c0_g1_i1.p1  ORF type:complete len:109 (+),score=21.78 TRINITY_DN7314_c0_g1_i1:25-327(+)